MSPLAYLWCTCIVRSDGPVGMQLGSWLDKHGETGEKRRQSNPPFSPPATATTHHLLQSGLVVTVELVRHCLSSSAACPCLSSLSVDFELNCTALSAAPSSATNTRPAETERTDYKSQTLQWTPRYLPGLQYACSMQLTMHSVVFSAHYTAGY